MFYLVKVSAVVLMCHSSNVLLFRKRCTGMILPMAVQLGEKLR